MLERQTAEETQVVLFRRIAAQDQQALSEFYDQTASALFSVAIRILGDSAEAEEAIQDAFVQIWKNAAAFDATLGTPFHWALSITRHRSIDRLRARQRRARLVQDLLETAVDPPVETPPAHQSWHAEDAAAVRSALESLPTEQRQGIEMAFFGGLTHTEIAEALGEPLGTIKARIRRGMSKLRESLQEYAS